MKYRLNDSGLQILEIEVTNRCNLNCKHCYVKRTPHVDLPQTLVKKIIEESNNLGVNRLTFTGGEPLLYSGLIELAQYAKQLGIPELALLTNGLLINESKVDSLKVFDMIQLSIDVPPKKNPVMRAGYSDTLEKKLDLLKSHDINVMLFATISKKVLPLIEDLVEFAKEKEVPIGFNRLIPILPALKSEALTPLELKEALTRVSKSGAKADVRCSDPLFFLVDEKRMAYLNLMDKPGIRGGCTAGIATIYITAFGKVYPCPFLQIEAGDVKEQSLEEIWYKSPILNSLRDRSNITGKCGKCKYLEYCGGCRAEGFINTGSLFESDESCFLNYL